MEYKNINYIRLLCLIPLFILFSHQAFQKSKRFLYQFSREKKSVRRYFFSTLCISMTIASIAISLTDPAIKYEKTGFNRSKIEILMGIDVSKSMLAEDAAFPATAKKRFAVFNRLNSARNFALRIISHLNGEQIGLYVFAEKSTEIIPMTNDYSYCRYIIRHVNESTMTIPGSDMSEAVKAGTDILKETGKTGAKILILISDGEDTGSDESLDNACRKAADKGIVIYTVGIGSPNKVIIPVRTLNGSLVTGYYKDEDGIYLKTRQVEKTLKKIADITGGQYLQADKEIFAKKLVEQIAEKGGNIQGTKQTEISRVSLSVFFLLAGFFFFISGFIYV